MNVEELFAGVEVQEPVEWGNIRVFPLLRPNGHETGYALLEDLIERGLAEVRELTEGGHVPAVKVVNRADVDALILDGTELRGAKQNRMVNVSLVVEKRSETAIPVTCVEEGRWSYRSATFAHSGRTVASKLRNLKAHMVSDEFESSGQARTDQGRVWGRVGDYLAEARCASPTVALDDAFEQRGADLTRITEALGDIDACGAVVAVNGEVVALDLLDHRDTFRRLWKQLLRGYAMDAVLETERKGRPVTRDKVRKWIRSVAKEASATPRSVPGVGQYYALRGPKVAGGAVFHGGRFIHTAVFPPVS